ncbi:hypothetical protein ATCC90586_004657 [Pythium insidiosum]|nr:hypothetical protein ATCC90586_004657 [Pythium insidiosum]
MTEQRSLQYEKRVRALRKRLTLDFEPLRETLSKGLDVLVDSEAAVLCTATVEALCDALFSVVIKNLQEEAATSVAPLDTKITVFHLQVALRSHRDLAAMLGSVDSADVVLDCFLDDATSKALYQRQLIATRDAKHLRPIHLSSEEGGDDEDELIRLHERTRSEWQRREDDPFAEVDFARVLKCVHPAFTLSYNATIMLSALVRELLNEVCNRANVDAVQRRTPPELYIEDLAGPLAQVFHIGELGPQIERCALDCLERFRLRSRKGATISLRVRTFLASGAKAVSAQAFRASPQSSLDVPRDTLFAQLVPQMCKKCHADPATVVGIYRGRQLEAASSPASLSMTNGAIVYLVSAKWWDHTRRNEARRGLMSSLRPQDALVKSLVENTESKVKREFQAAAPTSPFAFLTTAASPSSVLTTPGASSNSSPITRRNRTGAALLQTSSSAPRLVGVGSPPALHASAAARGPVPLRHLPHAAAPRQHRAEPNNLDDGDDHEDEAQDEPGKPGGASLWDEHRRDDRKRHEDSLSTLLQQRHVSSVRHQPDNNNHSGVEPALRELTTQSAALMDALDQAWLGFASISGGARGVHDRLRRLAEESSGPSPAWGHHLDAVAQDLGERLEKVDALIQQTTHVQAILTQLLRDTRRLRDRR